MCSPTIIARHLAEHTLASTALGRKPVRIFTLALFIRSSSPFLSGVLSVFLFTQHPPALRWASCPRNKIDHCLPSPVPVTYITFAFPIYTQRLINLIFLSAFFNYRFLFYSVTLLVFTSTFIHYLCTLSLRSFPFSHPSIPFTLVCTTLVL